MNVGRFRAIGVDDKSFEVYYRNSFQRTTTIDAWKQSRVALQ